MSPASSFAFASASRAVASWLSQISFGSCSTQPGCGKIWRNSCCASATMRAARVEDDRARARRALVEREQVRVLRVAAHDRWVRPSPCLASARRADARIVAMPIPSSPHADDRGAPLDVDVLVVGGGINGAGIARDLAGAARASCCASRTTSPPHLVVVDQADPRRPALPRVPRVLARAKGARRARGAAEERAAHHVAAALRDAARPRRCGRSG